MEHYVGLDVSLKLTAICIVDRTGKIEREGVVTSDPETIASVGLYHELRWRRRSGWLYSLICLLVAGGLGVVVSSFMTPLVLLAVGLPLKLAARMGISPRVAASGSAVIRDWARYQLTNFGQGWTPRRRSTRSVA